MQAVDAVHVHYAADDDDDDDDDVAADDLVQQAPICLISTKATKCDQVLCLELQLTSVWCSAVAFAYNFHNWVQAWKYYGILSGDV